MPRVFPRARITRALQLAAVHADCTIHELLAYAANKHRHAVTELLRYWPDDWAEATGPRRAFHLGKEMRDYLLTLAPKRTMKGRNTALHGIPVLVAQLRALDPAELVD